MTADDGGAGRSDDTDATLDGVPFPDWEPIYEAIRAEFGFSRDSDVAARDRLHDLTHPVDVSGLHDRIEGATVAVVAPATLDDPNERERARAADARIAASDAAAALDAAGIPVDCQVTDLDGAPAEVPERTRDGTPVAVHAHGDNRPAIAAWVPRCDTDCVIATTQVEPRGHVRNPGGFTDGDRAAFLAHALGARRLTFPGWDLDDGGASDTKRRKLAWAARLLHWLERRRGERFGLLDGRRSAIDPLPPRPG